MMTSIIIGFTGGAGATDHAGRSSNILRPPLGLLPGAKAIIGVLSVKAGRVRGLKLG